MSQIYVILFSFFRLVFVGFIAAVVLDVGASVGLGDVGGTTGS